MSRTRIYWTDDERDLVIEAIAEHIRKKPRARYAELWAAGNAILSPDRQRKWYSSYSGVQNSDHVFFSEARKRVQAQESFQQHAEFVGTHLGNRQEHVPHEAQPEVTWVPVPTTQTLDSVPLKELIAEVAERLIKTWMLSKAATAVEQQVFTGLKSMEGPARDLQARLAKVDAEERVRPVRIACCGLLQAQFARIKERVNAKKVELVFVDKQYDPHQSDWKRGLDHVIVTRFVRHGHWDQARAALGNERVHWVSSGTETVVAKVSELVPGSLN